MTKRLMQGSAPLTVTGLLMLVVLAATLVGLVIDPRLVTGAPVWLKPAKFAVSIAVYVFTVAWIFSLMPDRRRVPAVIGWTTALTFLIEMGLVCLQAARGTASHFNVATPLDGAIYGLMGALIMVLTATSVALVVLVWRHRFADRALGWAVRLGVTINLLGALSGWAMTQPTSAQLEAARAGHGMTMAGAHTVGAPDGGPGLPGTGWSLEHGDVRVGHFVGLHAMQALPIVAVGLRRRRVTESSRVRLTLVAAGSQTVLFGLLLWQAFRGQSVLAPDALTATAFAAWMTVTLAAAVASLVRQKPIRTPATV